MADEVRFFFLTDPSSSSEKKVEPAPEKKPRASSSVLKRNNSIKKEMRPHIEQAVVMKLQKLGVRPVSSPPISSSNRKYILKLFVQPSLRVSAQDQGGLKSRELTSILAKVHSRRENVAKGKPEFWRRREEISSTVEQKLGSQRTGSDPAPESQTRSRPTVQGKVLPLSVVTASSASELLAVSAVLQIRPRSSSLPSRATQAASGPAVKQPKTPQPAPRTRTTTQPKTSTPITKTSLRGFTHK